MTLFEKLVFLRKKKGLSQMEISESLNVSRQAVSRWESGTSTPSVDNLRSLCKIYDVTMDYLLNEGEDDPYTVVEPNSNANHGAEHHSRGKNRLRLTPILFIVFIIVLVGLFIWRYSGNQQDAELPLNDMSGKELVPEQGHEFVLNFDID